MKLFKALDLNYGQYANAVRNYISKTFSEFGEKYNNSTIFGQIISVIESTVQNIMLYIEDAFAEQNKYTAMRKKSIFGLAQISGYNPSLGKAATAQVNLSYKPSNEQSLNIIIENHTPVVCNQNGLVYQMILPQDSIVISLADNLINRQIQVVEGSFETQTFVVSGGDLYLHHVEFIGDIDSDYMTVKVNNEEWEQVSCLYDMDPDGKQWFYKTSITSGIILGFGNNTYGRALTPNDVIEVSYLRHTGEYGNINASEAVKFTFVTPIKDISGKEIDGNNLFNITLANKDNISSGAFSESADQVKNMIGFNSRSLVLAAPENYKALINHFSFCGYNKTWSDQGSLVINSLIMKNYKSMLNDGLDYFKLTPSDFVLSDSQKDSIKNYINNSGRQLAGVVYNIFDPIISKYALYVYIKLKSSTYNKEYISNNIRKIIGEFFGDVNNDDYIPKSDIIKVIKDNIPEVDGVNCYFISCDNEKALIEGQYEDVSIVFNPSTGAYDKKTETVYLEQYEDPGLGLDAHGNIYIPQRDRYPVLMGGWQYRSSKDSTDLIDVNDPLIIVFE